MEFMLAPVGYRTPPGLPRTVTPAGTLPDGRSGDLVLGEHREQIRLRLKELGQVIQCQA
jgi:hypothetical protein